MLRLALKIIMNHPLMGEPGNDHHNRKAKELREKQNEESGCETKKKPRLSWNPEMHQRFVQAINKLGYEIPKKIVEFMNEPGLISHLQKYCMNLRKGQDCSSHFIYGQKLTNDVTNPIYGSCPSSLNFNPSHTYSFPFERSNSVFSTPLLGQSYLLNPNISTTLTQPHMFPANNLQGALNHIFPPESSFDTKWVMNQNGEMEFQSSFVPRTPITSELRVYGDEKNKMVCGIIEKGHSSGSSSVSMNQLQPTIQFVRTHYAL